jgi:hypothetical protein
MTTQKITYTKIIINDQHLTGDDPENFDSESWVEFLKSEYRKTASEEYPDAEIEINIDVQHATGYCRSVTAYNPDTGELTDFADILHEVQNRLWDRHSDEFYRGCKMTAIGITCTHPNMEWQAGYADTREVQGEASGYYCHDCDHFEPESRSEHEMAKADYLYDPFAEEQP